MLTTSNRQAAAQLPTLEHENTSPENAPAAQLCELHTPSLLATALKWLGFTPAAREHLVGGECDLLKLLKLSKDQVDGLTTLNEFDKVELKRWQRAAVALADVNGGLKDDQLLVRCSVQYALYTHLADRALEIAGADIKPHDIEVLSVRPGGSRLDGFLVQAKLRVDSALIGKLEDMSTEMGFNVMTLPQRPDACRGRRTGNPTP
jgi:hypothetical protein